MNKNLIRSLIFVVATSLIFSYTPIPMVRASDYSLSFSPDNFNYEANSSKTAVIVVDAAEEKIVGIDLVMEYDPSTIEVTAVGDLKVFSYKVKEIIDNKVGRTKVGFSNDFGKTFSGTANIATVFFNIKNTSKSANIKFVFSPGETKDTNIVNFAGRDVLTIVGSLNVNFNSAVESTPTPTSTVLGNKNKPTKATDKVTKIPKKPNESGFVFPDNIKENPQVLGEEFSLESPAPNVQKNPRYVFVILAGLGFVLFIILAAIVLARFYKKNER